MTKREALTEILVAFGELHQREISPMLVTVFLDALGNFSIEELQAAGRRLLASEEFFPKPIKFIEAIQGSVEDRGAIAWNLLVEALRKYSAWDSLEITDDPAFVYALEQVFGSWIRCGDSLPDAADPMFASLRKQFMGSYRAYDRSGRTIALPRALRDGMKRITFKASPTGAIICSFPRKRFTFYPAGNGIKARFN